MCNLFWFRSRKARPVVASLLALEPVVERPRAQFEVMVRHLYDRLLHNEVFGEDATARLAELSYAIALPGVLVALFLFPAYHGLPPHPAERSFWSQACDHLFFVTYAMVVMGGAVIFQWEMLFPDALDVAVMTTLPISLRRLLTGRVVAVTLFLLLVHVGTSGLGAVFLPAVADQRCGYFRQVLAQVTAVTMGGACVVAALVTTQAVLLWLPRGRLAEAVRAVVRVVVLTALMTVLFLFPLTAHYLEQLLGAGGGAGSGAAAVRWFPPFWFLGVYETVMWGGQAAMWGGQAAMWGGQAAMWGGGAARVFHSLAETGVLVTAGGLVAAAVAYPLGYRRRVRQLVEGSPVTRRAGGFGGLQAVVDRVVLRSPRVRATAHLAVQTLLRTERLHLYLAMYVGLGTALVLSGVLALRIDGSRVRLVVLEEGLRMAVPVVAFWAVAGMKTALRSPVGRRGSWIFRAIGGGPGEEELRGVRLVAVGTAWSVTLLAMVLLDAVAPRGVPGVRMVVAQLLFACGLPLLLTELFFSDVRAAPFTGATMAEGGERSVNQLPLTFVLYFVVLPAFALLVSAAESRAAMSTERLAGAAMVLGGACVCARSFRLWRAARPAPQQEMTLLAFHPD